MPDRSWELAKSLVTLRAQLNAGAPQRSRVSDGSIGDANHLAKGWASSDHNPWWPTSGTMGLVRAVDITHDPRGGLDCHVLASNLAAQRDPRLAYVIWDGDIADHGWITRTVGGVPRTYPPWTWLPYTGTNKHDHHLHASVVATPACQDPSLWALPMFHPDTRTVLAARETTVSGPWALTRTELPAGKFLGDRPQPGWPAVEDVITLPGPTAGWRGRELYHLTTGFGGAWIEEAWLGPGPARHVVPRWNTDTETGGLFVPAFTTTSWDTKPGERFLVIRYACPAGGSVGIETEH